MKNKSVRRAFLYLSRKKSRAAILFGVFFAVSVLVLAGTALSGAVGASLEELKEQFYACLSIEQTLDEGSVVTTQLAELAVETVRPREWSGTNVCYLSMNGIELLPGRFTMEGSETARVARLIACTDSGLAREFTGGTMELVEGRQIEPGDAGKAVISDTLAEQNGLSVGDVIEGEVTDELVIRAKAGIGTRYGFEIVGIYTIDPEEDNTFTSGQRAECDMHANYVFVDEQTGFDIVENVWQRERCYANGLILRVADPALLEEARAKLEALPDYDWESYFINTNNADYDRAAEPMTRMESILNLLLMVILAAGVILLAVMLSMWNRERTNEVGILLSLGCAKSDILVQLLTENLSLFLAGFVLSVPVVGLGTGILGSVAGMDGVMLRAPAILAATAAGIALCAAVTTLASIVVMRLKPREILSMTGDT